MRDRQVFGPGRGATGPEHTTGAPVGDDRPTTDRLPTPRRRHVSGDDAEHHAGAHDCPEPRSARRDHSEHEQHQGEAEAEDETGEEPEDWMA